MRPALTSIHNPFHNRFNYPVTRRQDDMQADAYTTWLRQRQTHLRLSSFELPSNASERSTSDSSQLRSTSGARIFAGALALFLVVLSVAVFLRAFLTLLGY